MFLFFDFFPNGNRGSVRPLQRAGVNPGRNDDAGGEDEDEGGGGSSAWGTDWTVSPGSQACRVGPSNAKSARAFVNYLNLETSVRSFAWMSERVGGQLRGDSTLHILLVRFQSGSRVRVGALFTSIPRGASREAGPRE